MSSACWRLAAIAASAVALLVVVSAASPATEGTWARRDSGMVDRKASGAEASAERPQATSPSTAQARAVVIDTDMSVDDWMAILFLLHRRDVSVKAITVSGTGVAHGHAGARNAIRLLDLDGRRNIPVAHGRETTYPGGRAFPFEWRPALDGMLGIQLPPPSRAVSPLSAAKLIAKVAARSPVEILELAPPTNVADALRATPGLAKRITSITLMSGAVKVAGNAPGSKADWNFYVDPVAADIVLRSGIPWTLVPLDATNAVPYNEAFYKRLGMRPATAASRFVLEALTRQTPGKGLYFWDPLAAAVLVDPSVATLERLPIRVVTNGFAAGQTVEAGNGTLGQVALEADQGRFEELFLATLNTPAATSTSAAPRPKAARRWTNSGPEGGLLAELTIHPKAPHVVYARSWAGLFRSIDGGVSWLRRPAPRYLGAIAVDPEDARTVYAAGGGIYRTQDGGANWVRLPLDAQSPVNATLVAVSPSSPQVIYAVSYTYNQAAAWLWRGTDAGMTWVRAGRIQAAGKSEPIRLLVDPVQPATVYVQVRTKGLFRSEDGGKTWRQASAGLPIGRLTSLAIDPATSGVLYAGTTRGDVFRSVDFGKRWTAAARGLDGAVSAVAVSPADGAAYAGTSPTDSVEAGGGVVYRSADGLAPWSKVRRGITGWYVVSVSPDATQPGRVLAATEHGIFLTTDGGAAWAESASGLIATNPAGLAVDPANPRVVFVAVERGIAVSRDGGSTWSAALDVRGKRVGVGPLLAVPGKPATIYAVKGSLAKSKVRWTLLASRDAGRTWATAGVLPVPLGALVACSSRPSVLYGIRGYAPWQLGGLQGGIYKSVDGGRSWSQVYSAVDRPPATALAVDPLDPNVVYAGLTAPSWSKAVQDPLLKSEDGGRTWQRLRDFGSGWTVGLAADPRRRGILYALRYQPRRWTSDVRVSRDGGRTWAKLGRSLAGASALLVDPVRPGVVYVGTQDGVRVKVDGSAAWRPAGLASKWVLMLAADAKARRLYAGIAGRGVAATSLPLTVR